MKYNFYYDETEHSRKISFKTITADNYYDSFITAIVGWNDDMESELRKKCDEFETKFQQRKTKGEIKSSTFKSSQFEYGFASFNKDNIEMLNDLLSIIDDNNITILLSCESKIEQIINQLFCNYHTDKEYNMDSLKYSIIKSLLVYHPADVLKRIYYSPNTIVNALKSFYEKRIELNRNNLQLKRIENIAYIEIIQILNSINPIVDIEWDYRYSFDCLNGILKEKQITDYTLFIDKEGRAQHTMNSATKSGLKNVAELPSEQHFGIRMADMLCGITGKMMKSLCAALHKKENNETLTKNLLDRKWFELNNQQLDLYKKLYRILSKDNSYCFVGTLYADDTVAFLSLLEFMNHFNSIDDININMNMQPEYCNAFMISRLKDYFRKMNFPFYNM